MTQREIDFEIEESWREGLALVRARIADEGEHFYGYDYTLPRLAHDLWSDVLCDKVIGGLRNTSRATGEADPPYEPGYVYLLHSQRFCFKIGKSKSPNERIENIGLIVPMEIRAVRIQFTDSMSYYEKWLHAFYAHRRYKGEWFNLSFWDFLNFYMHDEKLFHTKQLESNIYGALDDIARDFELDRMPKYQTLSERLGIDTSK